MNSVPHHQSLSDITIYYLSYTIKGMSMHCPAFSCGYLPSFTELIKHKCFSNQWTVTISCNDNCDTTGKLSLKVHAVLFDVFNILTFCSSLLMELYGKCWLSRISVTNIISAHFKSFTLSPHSSNLALHFFWIFCGFKTCITAQTSQLEVFSIALFTIDPSKNPPN